MNKKTIILIATLSLALLWNACVKAPEYPKEPAINFIGYSKSTMKQASLNNADYIDIVVGFQDGDGDFGDSEDGKTEDVFIYDTRDKATIQYYKIPFVTPQGTGNGINGEMTLRYYTTCCKFVDGSIPCSTDTPYSSDTLRYKLWIKDRAGNKSNELELPPIFLQCKN